MASIIEVTNGFRAQVRRTGQPVLTKTFSLKNHDTMTAASKAAKAWAAKIEGEIDDGKNVGIRGKTGMTIGETIDLYIKEKELHKSVKSALKSIKAGIGKIALEKLTDDDIVGYIKGKSFGKSTGAFHFANLGSVLKMASIGWKYYVPDVMSLARNRLNFLGLIEKSKERGRRPTKEEIENLLSHNYNSFIPMADIIQFAICSSMRISEITRIEYKTLIISKVEEKRSTVVVTDRKHPKKKIGNHKIVPLLDEAVKIIERQKKVEFEDRIFPYNMLTISNYFSDACKELGIVDLHFHDLRHEGTSRLFEMHFEIHEVSMFTGHEDWKSLKRYTQLKAENVRKLEPVRIEALSAIEIPPKGHTEVQPMMDAATMREFEEFKRFKRMQEMMAAEKAA